MPTKGLGEIRRSFTTCHLRGEACDGFCGHDGSSPRHLVRVGPLPLLPRSQGSPSSSRGRRLSAAPGSGPYTFSHTARGRLHLQPHRVRAPTPSPAQPGVAFTFEGTATSSSRRRRLHLQGDGDFIFEGTAIAPSKGQRLRLQGGGDFTFKGAATSPSRGPRLHLQGNGDFTFKRTATSPSRGRRLHLQGDGDFTFKGRRTSAAPGSAHAARGSSSPSRGRRSAAAPGSGPAPSPARPGVDFTFKEAAVGSRAWFGPYTVSCATRGPLHLQGGGGLQQRLVRALHLLLRGQGSSSLSRRADFSCAWFGLYTRI